jgi:ABC-type antimicrobial peptide transport system permease subunit
MAENNTNIHLPESIEIKTGNVSIPLYGLIGGIIGIVVTVIMYIGGINTWFNVALNFSWTVALYVIGVVAALQIKKLNDGHLFFNTALKYIFGIVVIGSLIVYLSHYILMNHFDTDFAYNVSVKTAALYEESLRKYGVAESEIEKLTEDMTKHNGYTWSKMLVGFGLGMIVAFIISAIIAAIIKKNKYKYLGL